MFFFLSFFFYKIGKQKGGTGGRGGTSGRKRGGRKVGREMNMVQIMYTHM
jgi:hypothetical protein